MDSNNRNALRLVDLSKILQPHLQLEPVCYKKWQKSSNQETGLGNRGPLEALNDTKLILND